MKEFIDTGFTTHHDVVEYWDGGPLKIFRGIVTMRPGDPGKSTVKPSIAHFFHMDKTTQPKSAAGSERQNRSRFNLLHRERACRPAFPRSGSSR